MPTKFKLCLDITLKPMKCECNTNTIKPVSNQLRDDTSVALVNDKKREMGNEEEKVVSTNANRVDSNSILNSTLNQDNSSSSSNIQTVKKQLTDPTSTHTPGDQEKRISYSHLSSTQLTSLLSPSLSSSLSTLDEDSRLSMANLLECLNTFGLDLYKNLAARSQPSNENLFISPCSIAKLMLMCLSGAKPDSDTASHFKRLLNLSEFRNEEIFRAHKKSLNHLYTLLKDNLVLNEFNVMDLNKEENIKKEFMDNVTKKFQNNFTQKENILKLMHSKEKGSQGILSFLNTIYFKAAWLKTFRIKKTKQATFSTENGMEPLVDMMQITRNLSVCEHVQGLNASVCQLPYMGEKFVMSIILPTKGVNLSEVEQRLDHKLLKEAFEKKCEQKVKLQLPKFQFESQVELSADLMATMKSSVPFESDRAEFTQISNDKLSISRIFHRSVIEIGEKGTDAEELKSEGETFEPFSFDVEFVCNRPFLFVIHDKLFEHVLFVGKFATPLLVNNDEINSSSTRTQEMPCNLKTVMDIILNLMRCDCKKKTPTQPNKQINSSTDDESQSTISTSDFDFINSLRKFNFELYQIISSSNGDNNMFLSTASIAEIMLICLWGAKTSSETSKYFKQLLNLTEFKNEEIFDHVDETDSNAYSNTLSKDSIVIDKSKIFANTNINVRNDFKNVIKEYFYSEIENLNFSSVNATTAAINEWCAKNTENKIEKIIDSKEIDLKTCLIFANVIYFKAEFHKKFNACNTVESDFFMENGQKSKVQMMNMTEDLFTCKNIPGLNASLCELTFKFENLFMSIILPKTSDVKLNEIENEIEQLTLKSAFEQKREKRVRIQLPKLKFDYSLEVIPTIIGMMNGSNIPFDVSKAEFSNMSEDPIDISKIYHKTYFEIKEESVVDTAHTTIPSIPYDDSEGVEENPIDFICNRPFLFLIHDDEYENIYFVGKYFKPEN